MPWFIKVLLLIRILVPFACILMCFLIVGQRFSLLEEALCKVDSSDPTIISSIIDEYSEKPYLKEKNSYHGLFLYL
jgi:3-hydroxyisobutyryl-CoA hydrolase